MNWMNFAWIAGGLLGSLIVGLIIGRVVAGIKYPNPDKPHIFTPKQSAILLVSVLVAAALVIFSILYQPKPKTGSDDPMMGTDGMMDPGEMIGDLNGGLPVDDLKEGDPEPIDVQPGGEGEDPDGTDEDNSEEDGENSQPDEDETQPDVKKNPVT